MFEITSQNVADYLRTLGRAESGERVAARELTGGVSNVVLYVRKLAANADTANAGETFVLKQARPQLRVAQPWFCSVERNWRELAVLRACRVILSRSLPSGSAFDDSANEQLPATTPAVLWEDRENYAFAMSAAPAEHAVWKHMLLSSDPTDADTSRRNERIAIACGRLLARLHSGSWRDEGLRAALGDASLFDALRFDPYYRAIASVHADLRMAVETLIADSAQQSLALVHADFSPKNLLVYEREGRTELMMVDFETGHFGDPAFDLGFFLSHLVLKAIYFAPRHGTIVDLADSFWTAYLASLNDGPQVQRRSLAARAMRHLGACVVARLDGKSTIEYLVDPPRRDAARAFGRGLLLDLVEAWPAAADRVRSLARNA